MFPISPQRFSCRLTQEKRDTDARLEKLQRDHEARLEKLQEHHEREKIEQERKMQDEISNLREQLQVLIKRQV